MSRSGELFERALRVTPGGVHSPVRAFLGVGGSPLFIKSAAGAEFVDADGRRYVDFCMAFGPLILGHAPSTVRTAIDRALDRGWSFGTAEAASLELAELITANVGWVDQVRFVNSGTEAVMTALRLARAATGRERILKFDGCYHGHADALLIRAGSGLAGAGISDSAGVPSGVARDTLIVPLDDPDSVQRVFDAHGDEIAAAIIEPVPANHGLLPQRPEFLELLARACERSGALLIFDEVISGFRLAFGGYAELSGMRPDIVTWGKVVGGGFPVGAVAARRELMELLAPTGPVYQAGTLSANPVSMAAGLATLSALADGDVYRRLDELGARLDAAAAALRDVVVQRCGSLFWIVASDEMPGDTLRSTEQIPSDAPGRFASVFQRALRGGCYLPPSAYEVGFLSAAHSEDDVERLVTAVADQ